jgi:uncharacterized protein (TIGR03435 family)
MDTERYDIAAKLEEMSDEGLPGKDQPRLRELAEGDRIRTALQTLLAERFGLKFHRETKTVPGFALLVAKGGFKLTAVPGSDGPSMRYNDRKLTAKRASMGRVAVFLEDQLNQPVADLTHVEGFFDFGLEWSPDELRGPAPSDSPQGPSIFTALREQLGLKLESQKVPVETLVVDSAERPSEN